MARKPPEAPGPLPLLAMRKQAPDDGELEKQAPVLFSCLQPLWREGKCKRASGSLRVRLVGGYYQVTLSCPTEGLEMSMVTDTLVDLVKQIEARLNDPACIWTPDFSEQKKSRQVKIDPVT